MKSKSIARLLAVSHTPAARLSLLGLLALTLGLRNAGAVDLFNFSVPNTAPWYDTGIDIASGSQLAITATGIVQYGPLSAQMADANGGDYTGTQFYPDSVLPTTTVVSLIGKIGGTTAMGTGTLLPEGKPGNGPGFVGTSYNLPVFFSGRLFLGYNDLVSAFGDNSGSFSVTLSVTPVPEPSTAALAAIGLLALGRRLAPRRK